MSSLTELNKPIPKVRKLRQHEPTLESLELAQEAERLIVNFERNLRDFRILRNRIIETQHDKGVLGSRGLTEFVVGYLKNLYPSAVDIHMILSAAEKAGYAVPMARTLSKRLTVRSYRRGDIAWSKDSDGWYWKGN